MALQSSPARSPNQLLSALSQADFALLEPYLEPAGLPLRRNLEEPSKPIKHVYFPEAGFASVVATSTRARQIEVGIIGREGMTGINVVMGGDRSPHATYVQVAGQAQRIKTERLRRAMQEGASLRECLLRYAQAFMIQTAHTALANGRARLEQRLARWLLMAQDRLGGNELPLTHEFLALMLSVRRAGVTIAMHLLERKGLVNPRRGLVVVADRAGLVAMANGLYGIPEEEYGRLIGWRPEHKPG
jgi:CRP-like cAMP-binding protein